MIPNLDRAIKLIRNQQECEAAIWDEFNAYYAPGECAPIVERGIIRDRRRVSRLVHSITRRPFRLVVKAFKEAT